nr:NADH-plastoquinone oxidoreductase subunit 5 [Juncus alatus]ULQ66525.1 NADH-plastoquinone oxidoreductase subunit 5 [Juncus alatus]
MGKYKDFYFHTISYLYSIAMINQIF